MTAPYDFQLDDRSDYGNKPGDGPLAPGGQSTTSGGSTESNLPSTLSKRAAAQMPDLAYVRDCAGGPSVIRDRGMRYLPRDPGEKSAPYRSRLNRSVFFSVFSETTQGLTGLVFVKDPVLGDDVPTVIAQHLENVDNAGTHFDVFAAELFEDALTAGHNGILVEYPKTGGTQTARDEMQGAARPYWVPILKDNIVSWRTAVISGKTVLTQLVIKECTEQPDGAFGEKEVTNYRVLFRDANGAIRGNLLHITETKAVVILDEWDYPTQDEIPFAEIPTSGRKGILESRPPLLDLAYKNVEHYQVTSDRATSAHMTCVPIWVETGIDPAPTINGESAPEQVVLGPNNSRRFKNPAATAGYQSHSGQALSEVSKIVEELKADMAVLGLSMLAPSARHAETAQAKRMDKASSDSKLGRTARGLQDGLERALYFHARYLGLPSGGSVTINRDFENLTMLSDMLTAYVGAVANAGLPIRVMLEAMQKGGLLPDSANLDDIEAEVAANQAAQADQKRVELQMQLAAKAKQPMPGQAA
jgi:hypothetical protein